MQKKRRLSQKMRRQSRAFYWKELGERMDNHQETLFVGFAQKSIDMAERVDCSLEEFLHGLTLMQTVLAQRIEEVTDEVTHLQSEQSS